MLEQNAPGLNMKYYLTLIIRRRYAALSVALAVLSVCTWGSFFWPKTYEAKSTVLVENTSIIEPLMKDVGVPRGTEDIVSSLKNSIVSRNLLEKVIKKLDLDATVKAPTQYEAVIDGLRKNIDVALPQGARGSTKGSTVFTVTYRARDPKRVRDVVNALVGQFIEENIGFRRSDAYGAYEFIKGQLSEYKTKLEESDKAIREFREKNPLVVPQSETTIAKNIEQLQTGRMEAEIKLKELTRKSENLRKQLSGEKELTVAMISNDGSPQGRLNYLNNQLVILMSKYTENYPEVIRVRNEIEELKKEIAQPQAGSRQGGGSEMSAINPIYQRLKEQLGETDAEIDSLKARIGELSRQQQQGQNLLGRMPKEQEEWTKLQRNRNVYQKIYDELLEKLESARVSTDLEATSKTGFFKVLDPAVLPPHPLKPNRVLIILFGVALGIASGAGFVIGLESLKRPFKDESDIESRLKLYVLGTIPSIVTEEDRSAEKTRDRRVFIAASAYLFVIGLVLINEFLYRYMGVRTLIF